MVAHLFSRHTTAPALSRAWGFPWFLCGLGAGISFPRAGGAIIVPLQAEEIHFSGCLFL